MVVRNHPVQQILKTMKVEIQKIDEVICFMRKWVVSEKKREEQVKKLIEIKDKLIKCK